jgi:uncharacterized membrane protein
MSLRFVGDLPFWWAFLIASLASILCWRYYRQERHDLTGHLRWILPTLRSAAFFLVAFVLAGPVLHHRKVIGELGRVLIYLDSSQSMSVTDEHMSAARKLMIARQLGWLGDDKVEMKSWELAEELASTRFETLRTLQTPDLSEEAWQTCRQQFVERMTAVENSWRELDGNWLTKSSQTQVVVAAEPDAPPPQDIRDDFQQRIVGAATEAIPDVATESDIAMDKAGDAAGSDQLSRPTLTGICRSLLPFEDSLRKAFDDQVKQLDIRGDKVVQAALAQVDATSRWRRMSQNLLGSENGLLERLRETHDIRVFRLTEGKADPLWDGNSAGKTGPQTTEVKSQPTGRLTNLATGVADATSRRGMAATSNDSSPSGERTAVVLISDGQHNAGPSPHEVARLLGQQGVSMHTVGTGSRREPPDLALVDVQYPDTVFQKDRVRGTLSIRDKLEAGRLFAAEIRHGDDVLWREELTTQNIGPRRVPFDFSVEELVDRLQNQIDPNTRQYSVPLPLEAFIVPLDGESDATNNQATMRMAAITQNYRILLIDGRSRWETRYLRNAFERDTQWDMDVLLVGPGTDDTELPRGEEPGTFPDKRERLFEYDLIVFGDVAAELWQKHELAWIREYVELQGGGVIFIDGQRKSLREYQHEDFKALLPIEWTDQELVSLPARWQLTPRGEASPAFRLAVDDSENLLLWSELPPPHQASIVEPLADAEVLLEFTVDEEKHPGVVQRAFGAGRVMYCSTDETWRWRYKAADAYHQRFWHQLARTIMAKPFAASDEFASLDTGSASYEFGAAVDVRVRLLGVDGRPASAETTVDAVLSRDGQVVATVNLAPDATVPGIFRGRTTALDEGKYEVALQASGFNRDVLSARTDFVVEPRESIEFSQIACNEELLREMALAANGQYFREEQLGSLVDLLRPLSSGKIVESETLLWQSYWWFSAIIGLLAIEWMLRKRAGLL